ncbi:MAG: carboxypeptidase M32 [bacterium]|nr:carboxypeptidase M32 [bacterium]
MAQLSLLQQDLLLDQKFLELIESVNIEELNTQEKAVIRILKRDTQNYKKIPSQLIKQLVETTNQAQIAWRNARTENNFDLFAPNLEKIVTLLKQKAESLGYTDNIYDALLDEYEEGLTVVKLDKFFNEIEPPLKNLLDYIKSSDKYTENHPLETLPYDKVSMQKLNEKVLDFFKADRKKLRIDESTHPFTENISVDDVRITTRYADKDFQDSLTATIHEFGHALYELQVARELTGTPIQGGVSLGIHESQSRFFENMIGRTKAFIEIFLQDIKALSPEISEYVNKEGVDGVYSYFNMVKPSFIRVQADEITYHLHIKLRYEIEKGLINGEIEVKDLPTIWNDKMEKLLGVRPVNDSDGVLQDVHWSLGAIGYFPTYSIGTFTSGLIKYELEKSLGNIEDSITQDHGIDQIQSYLSEKINKFGSIFTPEDLLKQAFEERFTTMYLIKYLEDKYKEIY